MNFSSVFGFNDGSRGQASRGHSHGDWGDSHGGFSSQSQVQQRNMQMTQKRRLLLKQLNRTFERLEDYLKDIAGDDEEMKELSNNHAIANMNALRSQIRLATKRGDEKGLEIVRDQVESFKSSINESLAKDGLDDHPEINKVKRSFFGYATASANNVAVPVLPALEVFADEDTAREALEMIILMQHKQDHEAAPDEDEEREHSRLAAEAQARNELRTSEYKEEQEIEFSIPDMISHYRGVTVPMGGHDRAVQASAEIEKNRRREDGSLRQTDADGTPAINGPPAAPTDMDLDETVVSKDEWLESLAEGARIIVYDKNNKAHVARFVCVEKSNRTAYILLRGQQYAVNYDRVERE